MITLIVKGDADEALYAARIRNIPIEHIKHSARTNKLESVLVVEDDTQAVLTKIANWLSEDGIAPYPVGTLLTYSHHKGGE